MIQLAHVATGALAGRGRSGPANALLAGLITHAAIDVIPHGEVDDGDFELVTGALGVLAIGLRHGWRSPMTLGAIGGVLPDLEHLPQKFGVHQRAIFPTHRIGALHGWATKPLALPAWLQAVGGGAVIGAIAAAVSRPRAPERR